jgi:hypothetical protein
MLPLSSDAMSRYQMGCQLSLGSTMPTRDDVVEETLGSAAPQQQQKSSSMVRIQFELPEDKFRRLEELMQQSAMRTKKEFMDNAMTLLAWAIKETAAGRVIASVDEREQKYREILLPALVNVATLRPR